MLLKKCMQVYAKPKIKTVEFSTVIGIAKGSYADCTAIRRPAAPHSVALDHSLFGSPPDFLIYGRALSGSTPPIIWQYII